MGNISVEEFTGLIAGITSRIAGQTLDSQLDARLNAEFPADGAEFGRVFEACKEAIAAGWMCNREAGASSLAASSSRPRRFTASASMWWR